ncbi:nudt9 protein [Gigaspora margarita]|uniref:Nudt9 protein n=1 Tax=Gigaspora margarita TaxID=4874 RepID=A0A8H4EU22_GIGMA|nr:nudt9 protein [Gigaspora margarita]
MKINQEQTNFLINIKLLEIITFSFIDLSQKFPDLLKEFLSRIAFIVFNESKDLVDDKFLSSHLQNYRNYSQPFNQDFFNNLSSVCKEIKFQSLNLLNKIFKRSNKNLSVILIFPLPKFNTYPIIYNSWKELILPGSSTFTKYGYSELYKWWNGEVLLNFKWNTYGKYYFYMIWGFFSNFMGCFLIVSTLSNELSETAQNQLLIATIFFGAIHLTFEIRQFIYSPLAYLIDPWNYFDLGAILFPTFTSIVWLKYSMMPIWAVSISTLLLELKFLLFFRTIDVIGAYFAMIIGVAKSAFSFLIILSFIVFAFAHSLHILLRPTTEFSLNNFSYSNDSNNPWNLVTTYNSISKNGELSKNPILTESPTATTNMFTMLITSILAVYMMLMGDSTYLSNWVLTENIALVVLVVCFSFFTTIYLMNLFIGLLSNSIAETNKKELFLLQKAKV